MLFSNIADPDLCTFTQMEGPTEQDNRGKGVGTHKEVESLEACIELCKANEKGCESFLYDSNKKTCALKDLVLTGSEPIVKKNKIYFSVYKTCKEGNYIFH